MSKLNKIQKLAVAFVMAIALATPFALAQSTPQDDAAKAERKEHKREGKWRGHRGGGRGMGRIMGQLNLTDDQKSQIKQIHQSNREALRPIKQQIRAKRQEIRESKAGGTFDQALVGQKMAEIAALQTQLEAAQFKIHQETMAVLTPEQRTKLEQLREQFKSKREGRRDGRRSI